MVVSKLQVIVNDRKALDLQMLDTALSTVTFVTYVCRTPFCFRNCKCSDVRRVKVSLPNLDIHLPVTFLYT